MEAINGVMSRIADIQARIGALQPPAQPATFAGVAATGSGAGGSTPYSPVGIGSAASGPVAAGAGPASGAASFASSLSQAVASRSATPPGLVSGTAPGAGGAAVGGAPGVVGGGARRADGVPVDLAAYGNGKVPAEALSTIGHGSHRMWAPAAANYQRMREAAAREGVTLKVTDSYRSYEQQVDLARRKGLYSQGGLAAKPGTSEHGWGLSLDLDLDGRAQAWMRTHAKEYGFTENVPREPWHWTFTA
ncbi:D-alanyl-D-alanine carboxypeptidase-like protein [Kineococcus xinjiangensis]|uniref:D-alanyl-D-alanine carboxypeptidase-like protein n=1 Tax=Kineococcus xinjiangensis TaxID=512762 RepID=A0A2S6IX71_9ACTN|nr:M15 family metallopeptidase [Kineococcus xinjiangensis]PPK98830.1 D-alanyl-D-alanine carboxypeptidase-like protein [Kineococcus xinjiangensis]